MGNSKDSVFTRGMSDFWRFNLYPEMLEYILITDSNILKGNSNSDIKRTVSSA